MVALGQNNLHRETSTCCLCGKEAMLLLYFRHLKI